ncbi:MAG: ABC transporter permease/substrate-binding protein [Balneolaceae bacterium]
MNSLVQFFIANQQEIIRQTGEHIWLTLVALAIAILIGVPLGIYLSYNQKMSGVTLGFVGVIQTIPSIALLGFMLPLLGIGAFPAIVALMLYALLPIVRNTFSGIEEVESSVVEAARGMGMTDLQILRNVEIPLAIPVIFAGIRTATVINVGVATLCALIGAGGLGEYIFRGIALNNMEMILAGAIPAALLALMMDGLLGLIERHIKKLTKPLGYAAVFSLVLFGFILIDSILSEDTFTAGMPPEFIERDDGYKGLQQHYDFEIPTIGMDAALLYRALRNHRIDVIGGYSTDGRIQAYNLKVLKDDKNYFPPYDVAPLVYSDVLQQYTQLADALSPLTNLISTSEMIALNNEVDQLQRDPQQVARDFLREKGFELVNKRTGNADITVGGKNFTEHFVLGHLIAALIESNTDLTVEMKLGLAGTQIVFNALLNQEIDLYPEYTGTALYVLLDPQTEIIQRLENDPDQVYDYVKTELQQKFNLTLLEPMGFENSYTLLMRREDADSLGIETISDMVNYVRSQ